MIYVFAYAVIALVTATWLLWQSRRLFRDDQNAVQNLVIPIFVESLFWPVRLLFGALVVALILWRTERR